MLSAVEWLCGRSLPAVITKQPYLYMQAAENKDGTALSIALFNMNIDEVITPEIRLGREYRQVKLVGCEGELFGNILRLKRDIEPYGMAAFELLV